MYILVYIHARCPYSYLPKLSNVYPVISASNGHEAVVPLYPSSISRENIPYDIQLWYPDYIQIYPFVSNKDICFRYPWCYPIWLSWNILFILVLESDTILLMISNYDMLVISKYIHVYPILISILDILGVIPLCYPVISVYVLGIYPFVLTWCAVLFGLFLQFAPFFWLQRLANILEYPFISFHPTEGGGIAYFHSNPAPCA